MSFGVPHWLWGLLASPVLALLFVRGERAAAKRLRDFVSPHLLPQLAGMVDHFRRTVRFGLLLLGMGLAIVALAQPRWGYTYEDVKRKGIDLLVAVDTSRSMLSNDVQPSRLDRVKLATQDLITELQGDRVGLIAFAGRAFVQAPLTADYDAVVEAIHDLDTKTIPEGGTNISEAITLAQQTYGKSAVGSRALIVFTDGEDLSGDSVKTAKAAADAGIRVFTIGVGTAQGSLIPVPGEDGSNEFVKDSKGQVVKSKLDEGRLREIAQATGGFYLHLDNGPRTMQQLFADGIAKMTASDMDVRSSRRPIERYEWPLGASIVVLAMSVLMRERKRTRKTVRKPKRFATAVPVTALFLTSLPSLFGSAPGIELYQKGNFPDAYQQFQDVLKAHPETQATDKLQFGSGAAAFKMKDYNKALESLSQALLSTDPGLQAKSHYNLGNTLYERGDAQKADDKKLTDWQNALQHYEQTLKLDPKNNEAKENYEFVKKKIEDLKNNKETPTPPPQKQQQKNDKQDKDNKQDNQQSQSQQNQQQQQQNQDQKEQEKQQQQSQSQNQPGNGQNQKQEQKQEQSQGKNDQQDKQQSSAGQSPAPSPSAEHQQQQNQPSPSPGDEKQNPQSSSDGNEAPTPSPSPGEGEESGQGESPSPAPSQSPQKKLAGDIKGANGEKSDKPAENDAQLAEGEQEKEGEMSERQAEALLRAVRDEEARVQLDERKAKRHVYNDW